MMVVSAMAAEGMKAAAVSDRPTVPARSLIRFVSVFVRPFFTIRTPYNFVYAKRTAPVFEDAAISLCPLRFRKGRRLFRSISNHELSIKYDFEYTNANFLSRMPP